MTDKPCGKRHRIARPPKCNSKLCWAQYFSNNVAVVTIAARVIVEKGVKELEGVVGTKYVKFLTMFQEKALNA
jgi:hypothetical protein